MVLRIVKIAVVLLWAVSSGVPAAADGPIDMEAALEERTLGNPAAPVTVIEYASMTCPHCADFHNRTFKALKERYIDTGKVRFIYRDFPLDGVALRAAAMARCADGKYYFGLVELLYRSQHDWTRARDIPTALYEIGRFGRIDQATFNACVASEELLDGVLRLRQEGAAAGVRSTPTFIINDVAYPGSRSIEEFAAILDPLLDAK